MGHWAHFDLHVCEIEIFLNHGLEGISTVGCLWTNSIKPSLIFAFISCVCPFQRMHHFRDYCNIRLIWPRLKESAAEAVFWGWVGGVNVILFLLSPLKCMLWILIIIVTACRGDSIEYVQICFIENLIKVQGRQSENWELVEYVKSKTWSRINVTRKFKYTLDWKSLETIYIAFLRPELESADVVWDNCTKQEKPDLEQYTIRDC